MKVKKNKVYSRKPSNELIENFVADYDKKNPFDKDNYRAVIKVVKKFPSNEKYEDIFFKVNLVNSCYTAGVGDTNGLARLIYKNVKNIDNRLRDQDFKIISDLGKYTNEEIRRDFYSFATKYCHVHFPDKYFIYDKFVSQSLIHFRNSYPDMFNGFTQNDLRDYSIFFEIIQLFKSLFNITVNNKMLDRFLWSLGKQGSNI